MLLDSDSSGQRRAAVAAVVADGGFKCRRHVCGRLHAFCQLVMQRCACGWALSALSRWWVCVDQASFHMCLSVSLFVELQFECECACAGVMYVAFAERGVKTFLQRHHSCYFHYMRDILSHTKLRTRFGSLKIAAQAIYT